MSCILILGTTSNAVAGQSGCNHRILFLPQVHQSVVGDSPGVNAGSLEHVAQSQFKIAKFIERNSALPVFSEQVDTSFSTRGVSAIQLSQVNQEYSNLFPQGLPDKYDDLTQDQKQKLAVAGGELTQLMLGKIDTLNKVVPNRVIQDRIFSQISEHFKRHPNDGVKFDSVIYQLIFDKREMLALSEINHYFEQNAGQRDVILVYGSLHDFSRFPKLFPPECILIPFDFQKDHKGASISHPRSDSSAPTVR
jgi:hypothetical protein